MRYPVAQPGEKCIDATPPTAERRQADGQSAQPGRPDSLADVTFDDR
jgi:hypothetical protein